jgi:hypothetical protein
MSPTILSTAEVRVSVDPANGTDCRICNNTVRREPKDLNVVGSNSVHVTVNPRIDLVVYSFARKLTLSRPV